MIYEILNSISIGSNTGVTIKGNGEGLRNGITLIGDDSKTYKLLSVAMLSGIEPDTIGDSTELLIEGKCTAKRLESI